MPSHAPRRLRRHALQTLFRDPPHPGAGPLSAAPPAGFAASLAAAAAAAGTTLLGGSVALRLARWIGLLFAFSQGAVVGVAVFDLLPESMRVLSPAKALLGAAGGFAVYWLVDRLLAARAEASAAAGRLGPAGLSLHSFFDGLGVGFAFELSSAAGIVAAIAVVAHDMVDGANTVIQAVRGGADRGEAKRWLAADAAAPVLGVLAARAPFLPAAAAPVMTSVFAGFFVYIAARPGSERPDAGAGAGGRMLATLCGFAFIGLAVRLSGG